MASDDKQQNSAPSKIEEPSRPFNPLSKYASYTYNITLYAVTPEAYNLFVISNKTQLAKSDGVVVVAQSGGVNNQDSNRAAGFEFDYYIDDVKLTAAVSPEATQTSTVTYDVEFKIVEQLGFKFVTNLKNTLESLKNKSKILQQSNLQNATKLIFVMGFKFTGYDIKGNLISLTSDNLSSEKFYDILLHELKFKIDGTVTTYNLKAVVTSSTTMGIQYGVINNGAYNLTGKTVGDVLRQLMAKLTDDQRKISQNKGKTDAYNRYSVTFVGPGVEKIENALLANPYDTDKSKTTANTPGVTGTGKVNPASELRSNPNPLEKEIKFNNGTIILKAIEDVIKLSSYISEPLTAVVKNDVEPGKNSSQQQRNNRPFQWFNVQPKIVGEPKWDNELSSWYYNINYEIKPYLIAEMSTGYVSSVTPYYGPVKVYQYYYTGENSEILRYEQSLDNTYFTVVLDALGITNNSSGGGANLSSATTGTPGGNSQGVSNAQNLAAQNSAITYLMDPAKYARAKIDILGDPDWLGLDSTNFGKYAIDGNTINFTGQQTFIEIGFNEPVDYDHNVGTLTLNTNILFWNYPKEIIQKFNLGNKVSYRVIKLISFFKGGKFTQNLDLIINTFPDVPVSSATSQPNRLDNKTGLRPNPAVTANATAAQPSVKPARTSPISSNDDQHLISNIVAP